MGRLIHYSTPTNIYRGGFTLAKRHQWRVVGDKGHIDFPSAITSLEKIGDRLHVHTQFALYYIGRSGRFRKVRQCTA